MLWKYEITGDHNGPWGSLLDSRVKWNVRPDQVVDHRRSKVPKQSRENQDLSCFAARPRQTQCSSALQEEVNAARPVRDVIWLQTFFQRVSCNLSKQNKSAWPDPTLIHQIYWRRGAQSSLQVAADGLCYCDSLRTRREMILTSGALLGRQIHLPPSEAGGFNLCLI